MQLPKTWVPFHALKKRTSIFKSRVFLRIKSKISQVSDLEFGMFDSEDEKPNGCEK